MILTDMTNNDCWSEKVGLVPSNSRFEQKHIQ